jgi:gas vesicle protein
MKLNELISETLEQFISTAKDTSSEWVKFAKQNPLTQEVKARYPESLKKGSQFVDEQTQQFRQLIKEKSPKFAQKVEQKMNPKMDHKSHRKSNDGRADSGV